MKRIIIILQALLLLASCSGGKSSTIVEEFVGHNVSDVYEWCSTLDEELSCEIHYEDKDGVEKDVVFEQSITAGKRLTGEIEFKVASGKQATIAVPYVENMSVADVEMWKEAVGMENVTFIYEENETVEKNRVLRIEPMADLHKDTPIKVYVSSGPKPIENKEIEIKYGDYINLSVADFEKKAQELGLKPNHQESRDHYDSKVTMGNIVWHGSGTYVKDEVFNYGVCINSITVKPGAYVGKTEDEFKKIAKDLSLTPKYIVGRDQYSTTIPKGSVVTHGYGNYVVNEDFNYGLSKGPAKVESGYEGASEDVFLNYLTMLQLKGDKKKTYSDTVSAGRVISYNYGKYSTGDYVTYYVSLGEEQHNVKVPSFEGKSEKEFLDFLKANQLFAGARQEVESSYPVGTVVYNDTGNIPVGNTVNYKVAAQATETYILDSFDYIYSFVTQEGDYEYAAYMMNHYLFGKCFMNYEVIPVAYRDYEPGILLRIEVDGQDHQYAENVRIDAHIVCYISSDLVN